jgi:hypothetical protein
VQVDTYLEQFINNLQAIGNVSVGSASPSSTSPLGAAVASSPQEASLLLTLEPRAPWGIIPPPAPEHQVPGMRSKG